MTAVMPMPNLPDIISGLVCGPSEWADTRPTRRRSAAGHEPAQRILGPASHRATVGQKQHVEVQVQ
jgi:hypothetical protein